MIPLSTLHDLVDRARTGDETCLRMLFDMFRPLLRRVASRYARVAGYDEAYQEACAAFLLAIATHNPDVAPFPAYAARRVHGDTRSAMRRLWQLRDRTAFQREAEEREADVNEAWDEARSNGRHPAERAQDAFRGVDGRLTLLRLAREAKLSPREGAWLQLELAGLETDEIAQYLGVSAATIRTWRMRALRKMRQQAMDAGLSPEDLG